MEIGMIRSINWETVWRSYREAYPFKHIVIDNFFLPEIAEKLEAEFPDPTSTDMVRYKSPLENKFSLNKWNDFPSCTYRAFSMFGSENFLQYMKNIAEMHDLTFDYGLHGGGWHMHGNGGNLNVHLDYNLHPKTGEQRKMNIIVYLTKDWDTEWGGGLELWKDNGEYAPCRVKTVDNVFNRAIIFDTTENSWHGLPDTIKCPENVYRKSIAGYFLCPAPAETDQRGRALFVPREDQKDDLEVQEIIRKRANINTSAEVYRK
jgi:Rps23 Pro-64 3,4-dihydroxylase Tpa1-like proline 4-hydroxylase